MRYYFQERKQIMNNRILLLRNILVLFSAVAATAPAARPADKVNYGRPFEPPTRPAFIPLPAGAVEPQGWLRDWCLAAKNGYTGHMDDYHQEFRRAWAADHTMTGERLNWPKGGWPYEGGGYWFDGLVRLGYALHDDALIQQARQRLGVVIDHVNRNGILFLWWLDRNNPADMKGAKMGGEWPFWASGLLGRAMSAYYAASGDPRALQALETAYGTDRDFLRMGGTMSNPWPAFDTYTWTGNKEIAAGLTALFAKDGGGKAGTAGSSWNRYRQPPNPAPGSEATDHMVNFLETTTPWALGYLWTGKAEFLDAAVAWHQLLERDSMQPSGVPVADEFYGPVGAFRGTETCDVAGYLWSQIALLTITGDASRADRAERAFFNAGPSTVSRDFKTHVYFQTPNRMENMAPRYAKAPPPGGNTYKPTHFPLCCTAALNRILPNYVMHMWMATYDNGLAATHYGPSKVSALVAGGVPVKLETRTQYPFSDIIEVTVNPERAATFPLSFRIPGWCPNPQLRVNGRVTKVSPGAKGFARIERLWKPGDTVRLRLPMSVKIDTGLDRNSQDAPYASVSYGPLLFALPIRDTKDANTPDPAGQWHYALDVRARQPGSDIKVVRQTMPAKWDWPLASPLSLRANAVLCDWSPTFEHALPAGPIARPGAARTITLVPFGSTKFRVSMFPVTARLWESRSR
jgi:uncharacterized protein